MYQILRDVISDRRKHYYSENIIPKNEVDELLKEAQLESYEFDDFIIEVFKNLPAERNMSHLGNQY